jgi:cyclopropane-fatty-acyl-phospholipid synthase
LVLVRDEIALQALCGLNLAALAEAYLAQRIDVEGDMLAVMPILDASPAAVGWRQRLRFAADLLLRDRRRLNLQSISFHYDRAPDFFLPWLGRWRSYSHGFYARPEETLDAAQERKLRFACEALNLAPGAEVLDMGAGWGGFLEYAGRRGLRVHGITISREQHAFLSDLLQRERLPCRIELVDLLDFRPPKSFDGAVFMGTLEHLPDYRWPARWLQRYLRPGGRVYADFCAQPRSVVPGRFIREKLWPGAVSYVDLGRLISALTAQGFKVLEVGDDASSYAHTVRDWAKLLESIRRQHALRFGEYDVRTFLLFLRAHLVAERMPAQTAPPASSAHPNANQSPQRA